MSTERVIRIGRWVLTVAVAAAAFATTFLPAIVLDHSAAYGRVPVPGKTVLHLPAGTIDVSYREYSYNSNPAPVPNLGLSVSAADGRGPPLSVRRASSDGWIVSNDVFHKRVLTVSVPQADDYRVTARGETGDRADGTGFLFGQQTRTPGSWPIYLALVAIAAIWVGSALLLARIRRGRLASA